MVRQPPRRRSSLGAHTRGSGGAIRIATPDGAIYPMKGEILEIVAPERLVFTNLALDAGGNPVTDGLTTVTFAEEGGKTKLTLHTRGVALVALAVPICRAGIPLDAEYRQARGARIARCKAVNETWRSSPTGRPSGGKSIT